MKLHYDAHQFGNRRAKPVSAETGLSWQDYGSMSTHTRKQSGERRLPTPDWALDDALLRELLVAFMESRAGIKPTKGRLRPRLERARLAILAQHPRLNETLDRLNARYVKIQVEGLPEEETTPQRTVFADCAPEVDTAIRQEVTARKTLADLETEIEGLDTYIRYTRNGGAGVLAQVVYLYYRCRLDSVGVGEETGLKPPHVRQLLYRLNVVWEQKFQQRKTGMPEELPPEPLFAFLTLA